EKILDGASKLFLRYGVRSVTMDEVASALAISKKTIYQFFKNKDELVTSISRGHMALEKHDYSTIEENSVDAIDEITQVSECFRKHMSDVHPKILFELKKYHSDAWQIYMQFKTEFVKGHLKRNIERGIAEGFYRDTINSDILSTFRVEQVEMIFDDMLFPKDTYNFTEVQMQLFDHFVHGMLTDKGRTLYTNYLNHNKNSQQ
ncbi:MAG: TetR/AcrR family transcriptional regulator, partial [Cyclobacteriaceae bacterium]